MKKQQTMIFLTKITIVQLNINVGNVYQAESFHSLVRDIHSFKIMQNKRKIQHDSGSKFRMRRQDVFERFNQVKTILRDFEILSHFQKQYEVQYILRDLGSV